MEVEILLSCDTRAAEGVAVRMREIQSLWVLQALVGDQYVIKETQGHCGTEYN